jgi:ABC-type sulfate transport system, permease component
LTRVRTAWVRWLLICVSVCFLGLFIVLPLINVFTQAFSKGVEAYVAALTDPDSLAAIRLTLLVAATSVALNILFGLTAAWAITKFEFAARVF